MSVQFSTALPLGTNSVSEPGLDLRRVVGGGGRDSSLVFDFAKEAVLDATHATQETVIVMRDETLRWLFLLPWPNG